MRSDGARNLLTLAQALIANADLATGFLGAPTDNGPWTRHSVERIDRRAFGARVACERSFRRTERHLRTLAALGLIETHEIRIPTSAGPRSEIAVKRLTARFYEWLGLAGAVKSARQARDRVKGQRQLQRVVRVLTRGDHRGKTRRPLRPAVAAHNAPVPGSSGAPPPAIAPPRREPRTPPSSTGADAIAALRKLLGE